MRWRTVFVVIAAVILFTWLGVVTLWNFFWSYDNFLLIIAWIFSLFGATVFLVFLPELLEDR